MAEQAADPLAAGQTALASGDWAGASAAFEAALDKEEVPAAREGLSRALWWTDGPARAIAERTHAYSGYRRREPITLVSSSCAASGQKTR
jgi:hypothetical protein